MRGLKGAALFSLPLTDGTVFSPGCHVAVVLTPRYKKVPRGKNRSHLLAGRSAKIGSRRLSGQKRQQERSKRDGKQKHWKNLNGSLKPY
jgi:hypothetical protein